MTRMYLIHKQQQKRRGEKKFIVLPVFVAINSHKCITKLKFFFIVELVKKKIWANLQRITEF
jgi:hypothetical protein